MALPTNWVAGPQSAPLIKRSQYLADALKGLQEGSKDIRSKGELATRLLANAILQGSVERTNRDLSGAQRADLDTEAKSTLALLGGGGGTPTPAPTETIPTVPQPAPTTPAIPPPVPVQQAPLPPAIPQANRSDGSAPLGVRQNNPGNIRDTTIPWKGATGAQGGFEVFDGPESGIRALARNLMTYGDKGVNTPSAIAGRWAPPNENNTPAYAKALIQAMGGDVPLNMRDPSVLGKLATTIIQRENGQQPYAPETINQGVMAALGQSPQPAPAVSAQAPSPPAPAMPQQAMQGPQPGMAVQQPSAAAQGVGTAPAASVPSGVAGANPPRVTPQQIALYQRMISSGNPQMVAAARDFALELQKTAAAPEEYETRVTDSGQVVRVGKRSGQPLVSEIPGFRAPLSGNLQYGADGRAAPIPGTEGRIVSAEQLGIPAPAGTMFSVDATGKPTPLSAPPAGYEAQGGRLAPIPGGEKDPNSVANKLTALREFRTEVKPILDQATNLKRNVSAVRTGYQQQNGSGDIAMVNGLQKLIDEGVVREGDVALQLSAQGIQGGIAGLSGFLRSSGKFDAAIRGKILNTANQLYGSLNSTYKDRALGYRGIVDRTYGAGAFGDVVPEETIRALGWDGSDRAADVRGSAASKPAVGDGPGVGNRPPVSAYEAALAEKARRDALRKAGRK